ncbi:deoxyribonuclease IV [Brooklawnia cerclae]|uniref:Deoxyribonuclease-4 n=1 Tax=Brooklawnia cerclae TaxID=349934 RepID=A0ABX0SJV4_9ACTN|nr:deoxyribonuclease IV [Brooklawnia cerclae]NIH58614.1 deoxyribonuclease-4 [Brooklawnia cerclae]
MSIEIGAHVGPGNPIAAAEARGMSIVQIFIGDPQGWKAPVVDYPGGAAALRVDAQAAGVGLYVHAPYVINVASTNNRIRIPSRKLLQQQVSAAAEIGARGVIVHGGHVTANDDPAAGYQNWFKAVDGLHMDCPILIENTAGGAHAMARYVESIAKLWDAVGAARDFTEVGFCLDTCHAHASGEDLDGLPDRIRAITGRIDLVHGNDSRDAAGSGADRHTNLGQGQIDPDLLVATIRDAAAPVILETPGDVAEHVRDRDWLLERL